MAIYDNRVEITSPGGLPRGQTADRALAGYSKIHNDVLAKALNYMRYIEEWGSGLRRVNRVLAEYGIRPVAIDEAAFATQMNVYRITALGHEGNEENREGNHEPNEPNRAPNRAPNEWMKKQMDLFVDMGTIRYSLYTITYALQAKTAAMKASILFTRSEAFELRIVRLYKYLRGRHESVIAKQMLRADTSIGANVAESQYAQSKADFTTP